VIHRPPTIHADADLGVAQHAGEGEAGELAALVSVEDLGLAEARQGFLQAGDAEAGVHRVRQSPGQDLPACPIHDRDQVEEPAPHRNVRHIGTPHMVGAIDRQLSQQIGIDPVLRVRIAGAWPLVERRQAHLRHLAPPAAARPHGQRAEDVAPSGGYRTMGTP